MPASMLRVMLLVVAMLGLAGGAIAQGQPQPAPPQRVPAPDRHAGTGLSFPPQIAGATKYGSTDYGKTAGKPELGYGWNYRIGDQLIATVYVYDLSIRSIPDGPASPVVQQQFQTSLQEIYQLAKYNRYEDIKTAKGPTDCTFGSIVFRCITLSALRSADRKPIYSALMLTGYRNNFLKLRLDWLEGSATSQSMVDTFTQTLVGAMTR
jgi:hypothetical protein